MMNIHKIYLLFQKRSRPKRMQLFVETFEIDSNTRVLDVGGTLLNWSFAKVKPQLIPIVLRKDIVYDGASPQERV